MSRAKRLFMWGKVRCQLYGKDFKYGEIPSIDELGPFIALNKRHGLVVEFELNNPEEDGNRSVNMNIDDLIDGVIHGEEDFKYVRLIANKFEKYAEKLKKYADFIEKKALEVRCNEPKNQGHKEDPAGSQ